MCDCEHVPVCLHVCALVDIIMCSGDVALFCFEDLTHLLQGRYRITQFVVTSAVLRCTELDLVGKVGGAKKYRFV